MASDDELAVHLRLREQRKFNADLKASGREVRKFGSDVSDTGKRGRKTSGDLGLLGATIRLIKPAALIAGLGFAAQAMAAASAGALGLMSGLAPLIGVMAAYPALGLAAAQGMGVFKLATSGLSEALGSLDAPLDKTSKQFKALSPEGQRFALTLDALKPRIRGIQAAAQKGLFPGLERGVKSASGVLSIFRRGAQATGGVIGGLAARAGALVGSKGFGADLDTQMGRNNVSIGRLGGAGIHLADALRHVVIAAGPLVGWLTKMTAGWAAGADQAARQGRETGRLAAFFGKTRETMSQVLSIGGALVTSFRNIMSAGYPLGHDLLESINKNAEAFARWTGSAGGKNKIAAYFQKARPAIYEVGKLIRDVVKGFFSLGNQPGLASLINQVRTKLLPVLLSVVNSTTKAFGPHLVAAIVAFAQAFQPLAGSSGPLILYVDILASFARAVAFITRVIPGGAQAMTMLFGALAVYKAAKFADMITGFRGMRGAILGMRAATLAETGATNVSTVSMLRQRAAMFATKVAMYASAAATKIATAAQWLFNVAMTANPIGLVIVGIAALAAGFYLAYTKIGWFRKGVQAVWGWIKDHWPLLFGILTGGIGPAVQFIVRHFSDIKRAASSVVGFVRDKFGGLVSFFTGLPGRIGAVGAGMFSGIKKAVVDVIHWIHVAFNNLVAFMRRIPGRVGDVAKGLIPDISLPNIPGIPGLAGGGSILTPGATLIGERGPELLTLPRAAQVRPLQSSQPVPVRGLEGDGGGMFVFHHHHYLDGREITSSVKRHLRDENARG